MTYTKSKDGQERATCYGATRLTHAEVETVMAYAEQWGMTVRDVLAGCLRAGLAALLTANPEKEIADESC